MAYDTWFREGARDQQGTKRGGLELAVMCSNNEKWCNEAEAQHAGGRVGGEGVGKRITMYYQVRTLQLQIQTRCPQEELPSSQRIASTCCCLTRLHSCSGLISYEVFSGGS